MEEKKDDKKEETKIEEKKEDKKEDKKEVTKKEEKKDNKIEDKKEENKIEEKKEDKDDKDDKKEEIKMEEDKDDKKEETKMEDKKEDKMDDKKQIEEKEEDEKMEMEEDEKEEKKPGFRIEAKGAIKDDKDPINDTKKEDSSNPRYLLNQMYQRCDPSKQKDIIITKSEVIFIVGDTQRISVAKVNGKVEMDFRNYHFDDVMFLGKYGLNMSLKDWDNLKKKMKEIDEAIYKLSH